MIRNGFGRLCTALAVTVALTGCETGQQPFGFLKQKDGAADASAPAASASGTPLIEVIGGGDRDVESPETFRLSDNGLWDGRPSLGGVWVAHASVKDPERVIIRNPANGKSVIGALFRREIDNPGPSLQLSSDAAETLGMLAGQPAIIDVVALRRIEAPAPAAPVAAAAAEPVAEPVTGAEAAKTAEAAAATNKKTARKAKGIEAKPLEPIAVTAAAAIDKAAKDKTAGKKSAATAALTPTPTATAPTAAPAAAATGGLTRAYVQIGIFSVEANAKKVAGKMQKAGLTAAVKADTSQGKSVWRVIVGPAASVADRDAFAAKVKDLGYPDAYPVSR